MIIVTGGKNQGKTEFVLENFKGMRIVNGFHIFMKEQLAKGGSTEELIQKMLDEADIVICDEIGNGIVPIDAFDRQWREETGRAMCQLSKNAEAVYRVCAGIAQRIK
ncbi:hypothetical protein IMSAG049_01761 [Clostridiales bacterium]|nr:hypothetical protein IMSAG049_01761 [Clostridiales bacterium]